MNASLKVLVTVVILGMCLMGHYLLDYQSKLSELRQLEENLARSRQQLATLHEKLRRLPQLTAEMRRLEEEIRSVVTRTDQEDPEKMVSQYLADLERLVMAQGAGTGDLSFRIESVSPGASKEAAPEGEAAASELPPIPSRPFQVRLKGRYDTLTGFLERLSQMQLERLVTIDKIELAPTPEFSGSSPVLTITLPMTAYLRSGG
ncbi:MAG: hypothetical protein AB1758_19405 [Candidatus Eremiobacterota bacterium]